MSGRDFNRDRRGGFRDRNDRNDRDRRGGFGERPWERDRDGGGRPREGRDDERPYRPAGSRPFDRPERPPGERDVRTERYYEEPSRPPRQEREERFDRFDRFGPERDRGGAGGPGRGAPPPPPGGAARPAPAGRPDVPAEARRPPEPAAPVGPPPAAQPAMPAPPVGPRLWTYQHLSDSWHDEERLRGWTPSDQELQEMVEDNVEADPLLNARDRRNVQVAARGGVVTLTGAVRGRLAKFAAGSDAFWTYGAREVRNELAVRVRGPQADAADAPAGAGRPPAAAPQPARGAGAATGPAAPKRAETDDLAEGLAAAADTSDAGDATVPPPDRPVTEVAVEATGTAPSMDNPGFTPPRQSPPPNDPGRGRAEPPEEDADTSMRRATLPDAAASREG